MTTTRQWIISDVDGPPRHTTLHERFDEAVRHGHPVRLFSAAPPPVGGLQKVRAIETLIVGGHALQAEKGRVVEGSVIEGSWDEATRTFRTPDGWEVDLCGNARRR